MIEGDDGRRALDGATVAPRTSTDVTGDGRDGVVVGLTLFSPDPTVDIFPTDRIEVDGVTYQIVGDVGRYRSPFGGGVDGATCALERGQGVIQFKRDDKGLQEILNSSATRAALRQFAQPMADDVQAQHPDSEVVVDDYTAKAKGRFTERAATSVKVLDARGKLWETRDGLLTRAAGAQGLEVSE